MIEIKNRIIHISTKNTSYVMSYQQSNQLQNLHYGAKIQIEDITPLLEKSNAGYGGDVIVKKGEMALSSLCLELSPTSRGDYRRGGILATMPNRSDTTSFEFISAIRRDKGQTPAGGMPQAHKADEILEITMFDREGLEIKLFYSVFYEADVITKKVQVTNRAQKPITLHRVMSQQLDLPSANYTLYTLNGTWAREANVTPHLLAQGIVEFGSTTGVSSNRCNPFFFLAEQQATEFNGEVYGFNLVYSGNHEESVEVDYLGKTRILQGVSSAEFEWPLQPGEFFVAPEAVLTFSTQGKNGMSRNMHQFVKNHILPQQWNNVPRPILMNNWEGTYFDFSERKLLSMAKIAAEVGVELFVLDDGWFGDRNHDRAGLGDYHVNKKKLPSGIDGIAKKINGLGMDFGLWFEPEMVNEDSELFRTHPDWVVQTPGYTPAEGRNQYVLDLCRPEIQDYIIQSVNNILDSANIKYVKWDMNRNLSDVFSPNLASQGQFFHSYVLGLYRIFQNICQTHPDILFEGCASGGNRFDLGVLCYMPQIWTSDDTDAYQRQRIQTGMSYGYPQCTMGCHVSAAPNHQTLRNTPLETRFNTAMFGQLGYELDMRHLTADQKRDVQKQILYYKEHRMLLQYGQFVRFLSPFDTQNNCRWLVISEDKHEAILGDFLGLMVPNSYRPPLRIYGLLPKEIYTVETRPQKMKIEKFGGLINFASPIHVNPDGLLVKMASKVYRIPTETTAYKAYGSLLENAGIRLQQLFSGASFDLNMQLTEDFASRVYYIYTNKAEP